MTDQMKEAWPQIIQFITDTLKEGKAFTVREAPLVVQEYLRWYFYEAAFYLAITILLALAIIVAGRVIASHFEDSDDRTTMIIGSTIVALIILGIGGGINGHDMLRVKVAPRVVLLEYARHLVDGQ